MSIEIITPVVGQRPDTLIIPFRYIDVQEVADRTGGVPDGVGSEINQILYYDKDAAIRGLWRGSNEDGINANFMIGEATIGLYQSAIIMRPDSVLLIPKFKPVYDNVVFISITMDKAAIETSSRSKLLEMDPDVVRAFELATQWAPLLREAREAKNRAFREGLWERGGP